jgi:hypothetical protein
MPAPNAVLKSLAASRHGLASNFIAIRLPIKLRLHMTPLFAIDDVRYGGARCDPASPPRRAFPCVPGKIRSGGVTEPAGASYAGGAQPAAPGWVLFPHARELGTFRCSSLTGVRSRSPPSKDGDLREFINDRHGCASTIVASQLPVETWHMHIGDPTIATRARSTCPQCPSPRTEGPVVVQTPRGKEHQA